MINIQDKANCCGCGACVQTCPVKCISMKEDSEGFLFPFVDESKCIGCNACEKSCPIISSVEKLEEAAVFNVPKAYGGWIKDEKIRMDSSSGGAFTLFANYILKNGGIVYGAAMDEKLVCKHIGVETKAGLSKLRGSKYVQSIIGNVYSEIKEQLKAGRLVLFSGTPCQAAGLYSYLGKRKWNNLYVVDFICHGVPSPKVFADYMKYMGCKHKAKILSFKFRMKDRQWNPTGLQLGTGTGTGTGTGRIIRHFPGFMDPFMNGFLSDIYLRTSCYKCKFKLIPKYYSDITIADFWGVHKNYPKLYDGKGTSLVLINSLNGEKLLEKVESNFYYSRVDFDKAISKNKSLIRSAKPSIKRDSFFRDYQKKSFNYVRKKYMNPFAWGMHKIKAVINKA